MKNRESYLTEVFADIRILLEQSFVFYMKKQRDEEEKLLSKVETLFIDFFRDPHTANDLKYFPEKTSDILLHACVFLIERNTTDDVKVELCSFVLGSKQVLAPREIIDYIWKELDTLGLKGTVEKKIEELYG